MKVAFVSLGCAKNLVNTEQMMALVRQAGHTVAGEAAGADVAVLNTCGFIDSAKSEAIQNILELAALKDEGKLKKLLVTGCLSQRYQKELVEELPEVDGVLGTGSYRDIVEAVEANPAKAKQVRRFANYYLPDAVNVLQQYAKLAKQGVRGENAAAIRAEVEHNAASIATAFENQLDALYAAESMDLSADLTVLQNMLKGQGLSK